MTTYVAFAFALLALCTPAFADSASAASAAVKLRFAVRDGAATRTFDVSVKTDHPCASASERANERVIELKACLSHDAHLDIEWTTRNATGEYRTVSSVLLEPGARVELGSSDGPRLTVTLR